MRSHCIAALLATGFCAAALATPPTSPEEMFQQILSDHWDAARKEKIYFRNDPDAWRMDGRLSEHTPAARSRRHEFNESILERLQGVDPTYLNDKDRITYKVFLYERQTERDSYYQFDHRFPLNSLFGYHTYFAEAPANITFLTAADYERYIVSLDDFPRYNDERIAELQEGIDTGYTHYCESINGLRENHSGTCRCYRPRKRICLSRIHSMPASLSGRRRRIAKGCGGLRVLKTT